MPATCRVYYTENLEVVPVKQKSIWWVVGAAVAAVALLAAVQLATTPGPAPDAAVQSDAELGARGNTWGKAGARVAVVVFGDYQ